MNNVIIHHLYEATKERSSLAEVDLKKVTNIL